MPAFGTPMSQAGICTRALASPRQQGLSAGRPQFNARGGRTASYFMAALPAQAPGKFFP
ncbi:MAG: hypothetical protein HY895_09810 [Deltaproteobacteria bacterium]|nr:hypothetical protein [Deltaproteobacteria bacterium]